MSIDVNPEHFRQLSDIYDRIKDLAAEPDLTAPYPVYLDAQIKVISVDDYVVGKFFIEDDFWLFQIGDDK